MKTRTKASLILLSFIIDVSFSVAIFAKGDSVSIPQILFKITRSKDANEICYALNKNEDGTINNENPIRIYWIKHTENDKVEPLTWIQNRYAYGIHWVDTIREDKNLWHFQLVSYSKRTLKLRRTQSKQYKVFIETDHQEIELQQIYIQLDGDSFWFPNIPYIKMIGVDAQTGKPYEETIITQ